jgi:membrane associated rhomboid family serine protease
MIPFRDNIPSRSTPIITISLILINLAIFIYELSLGDALEPFIFQFGVVPSVVTHWPQSELPLVAILIPFLTSMFLHGGWLHLIGNMWVLWIFGDNVEDRLGRLRFLGLYFAGGIAAGLVHIVTNAGSSIPTLGASGAVAAIMGSYFRFFPHARVATLIPPFFLGPFFELPALLFLGWWFFLQFFNGALSLAARGQSFSGVAWWAHVGGFAFGMGVSLFAPRLHKYHRSFFFDKA